MKFSFLNPQRLPAVVEPEGTSGRGRTPEALLSLCNEGRAPLREMLSTTGALLFRGFSLKEASEFARFVRAFSGKTPLDYVGGASPGIKLGGGVYTSTEYPRHYTLSLHNELSYTYKWPEHLYFFCVSPAERGGETPLGDSRRLLGKIDAEVVGRFKERRIRYDRRLHGGSGFGLSWQDAFETDDRTAVERYCQEGNVRFRWDADGGLRTSQVRPATHTHPRTGEEVWFNQADAFHTSGMHPETYRTLIAQLKEEDFPLGACHGDGSPLDPRELEHVREVMAAETALFAWDAGDILVLDNVLTAHGRMPYEGPRKILLAMT